MGGVYYDTISTSLVQCFASCRAIWGNCEAGFYFMQEARRKKREMPELGRGMMMFNLSLNFLCIAFVLPIHKHI